MSAPGHVTLAARGPRDRRNVAREAGCTRVVSVQVRGCENGFEVRSLLGPGTGPDRCEGVSPRG